jgi:hypothetical protein
VIEDSALSTIPFHSEYENVIKIENATPNPQLMTCHLYQNNYRMSLVMRPLVNAKFSASLSLIVILAVHLEEVSEFHRPEHGS